MNLPKDSFKMRKRKPKAVMLRKRKPKAVMLRQIRMPTELPKSVKRKCKTTVKTTNLSLPMSRTDPNLSRRV